jgi:asparagine synthase (glutamine-hydrolysing)
MCGIAGVWEKNSSRPVEAQVQTMLDGLVHRGPDAEGIWSRPGLALGNRRLKILDLSDDANQPFTDGEDVLVFNGRIFNYLALQQQLRHRFVFRTRCDTEVLFRALQVWGAEALDRIQGQFAFAFFRSQAETLLLARDHVGICPLYTIEDEDRLVFSSEIRPLLSLGDRSIDGAAVVDYFAYRYNIQNGRTLFDGIRRFDPGHFVQFGLKDGSRNRKRYWRLAFDEADRSDEETQVAFNEIMDSEVGAQKAVDVPAGMYLSGGIDSGALLSGFTRSSQRVSAYTLAFSSSDPEVERVAELAQRYDFDRNLIHFSEASLDHLEEDVQTMEEPFGDLIICANRVLASRASQDVRVILSGEGGDESFCGYDHQRGLIKMFGLAQNPVTQLLGRAALRMLPPSLITRIQSYPGRFGPEELARIRDVFGHIKNPLKAYLSTVSLFEGAELASLFSSSFVQSFAPEPDSDPLKEIFDSEPEPWRAMMRSEVEQMTLIVNLLKQDRFGMSYSMEGCVPLVSRPVVEFAGTLPFSTMFGPTNKALLLNYSGSPAIAKAPFSLFTTPQYLSKISELIDLYVTRDAVEGCGVLSWDGIKPILDALPTGNVLVIKRSMAILVFMVWWSGFRSSLRSR